VSTTCGRRTRGEPPHARQSRRQIYFRAGTVLRCISARARSASRAARHVTGDDVRPTHAFGNAATGSRAATTDARRLAGAEQSRLRRHPCASRSRQGDERLRHVRAARASGRSLFQNGENRGADVWEQRSAVPAGAREARTWRLRIAPRDKARRALGTRRLVARQLSRMTLRMSSRSRPRPPSSQRGGRAPPLVLGGTA